MRHVRGTRRLRRRRAAVLHALRRRRRSTVLHALRRRLTRRGRRRRGRLRRLLALQRLETLVTGVEADGVHAALTLLGQLEPKNREVLLLVVEHGSDQFTGLQTTTRQVPVSGRGLGDDADVLEPGQEGVRHRRGPLEISGHEDTVHVLLLGQERLAQTRVGGTSEELPHPRVVIADVPAVDRHLGEGLDVHVQEHRVGAVLVEGLLQHPVLGRSLVGGADRVTPLALARDRVPVEPVSARALRVARKEVLGVNRELLLRRVAQGDVVTRAVVAVGHACQRDSPPNEEEADEADDCDTKAARPDGHSNRLPFKGYPTPHFVEVGARGERAS